MKYNYCPKCGTKLNNDWIYCPCCGFLLCEVRFTTGDDVDEITTGDAIEMTEEELKRHTSECLDEFMPPLN